SVRSYLVARLAAIGADPGAIILRFEVEPDVSARRALVIALGDFPPEAVPAAEREPFVSRLLVLYREHPDPGLHSAIDWLLRQRWGTARELEQLDAKLATAARGNRDWYVNGEGQSYAVVRSPAEVTRGSCVSDPRRVERLASHRR